jgi:hypothetical protein
MVALHGRRNFRRHHDKKLGHKNAGDSPGGLCRQFGMNNRTGDFAGPASDTLLGIALDKGAECFSFHDSCSNDRAVRPLKLSQVVYSAEFIQFCGGRYTHVNKCKKRITITYSGFFMQ